MCRSTVAVLFIVALLLPGCSVHDRSPRASTADSARTSPTPPADKGGFTTYIARMFEAELKGDAGVDIKGQLTLGISGEGMRLDFDIYLNRPWNYCSRNPASCESMVAEFVADVIAVMREPAASVDKQDLRLVVEAFVDHTADRDSAAGQPGTEPLALPLAGDLSVLFAVAEPSGVRVLTERDLAGLGLSAREAVELATGNLARVMPPLGAVAKRPTDGTFGRIDLDGLFEASRLVLHDDWADLARQTHGGLVVAVPHRGLVIYGDAGRPETVQAMRRFARDAAARAERPLSPALLKWDPGGWRRFDG